MSTPTLTCEKCGKEFNSKSHYTQHQKRKTPCVNENKIKGSLKEYELVKNQYDDSRKNMDQYKGMDSNAHSFMTSSNYYLILSSILAIMLVVGGIKLSK